jgi:pimeloyl-ACP methyl ester carboxylesterase
MDVCKAERNWTGNIHVIMRSLFAISFLILVLGGLNTDSAFADTSGSQVVSRTIRSENIANNKIGTNPERNLLVYLPVGYRASSPQRYPVIYFLPNPFQAGYRYDFDHRGAQRLFDQAIAAGIIGQFILVAIDMDTPLGASWYVNSPATGNWEDFMTQDVVPYIDANFKTLADRNSRGIAGVFIGGYGAIRFGMRHPEIFGAVYAMHPVGTGSGVGVMAEIPKWDLLVNAKVMDDVRSDGRTRIFAGIFQAHLPNPQKPPLFVDLPARQGGEGLIIDPALMERLRSHFYLDTMIPQYAENLKSLRGFKFDWSRQDGNFDHIFANQAFTRKLNEYGIEHGAEEYNGPFGGSDWDAEGRIYTEAMPFFAKTLVFKERRLH